MGLLRLNCLFILFGLHVVNSQSDRLIEASTKAAIQVMQDGKFDNRVFSPCGITSFMGTLFAGAAGDTKSQIGKSLFDGLTEKEVNQFTKSLLAKYSERHNPSIFSNMSYANRLYAQNDSEILPEYLAILSDNYDTEIESVDFEKNAESVRREINQYVEDETRNKIKDLLPENSLNGAKMVLVNAIYYKDSWKQRFDISNTQKKDFYRTEDDKEPIDMMNQNDADFYYYEDENVQVLGLPFVPENDDREVIMYIILPVQRFGLAEIVSNLTVDIFQKWFKNGQQRTVQQIDLPKFTFDIDMKADEVFKNLGMTDMFNRNNADFSRIDGKRDLHVSKIVHRVFLEVSEDGLEQTKPVPAIPTGDKPVKFLANQPFLFTMVEKSSLNVFIMGRFVKSERKRKEESAPAP
jgi:serpin B